ARRPQRSGGNSMEGREVVIVEAVRTPVGRGHPEKGYYRDVHPNELLGRTWVELIERGGVPAEAVEDVITGCVQQYGEQSYNIGRHPVVNQGVSAELIAERWGVSRRECDEIALRSHQRAARATDEGRFERELLPFRVNGTVLTTDQGIRRETTLEALAELKPAFKEGGLVTAGNSSQVSDGAAAVLLMSR